LAASLKTVESMPTPISARPDMIRPLPEDMARL
jgi:hypothetical protein